MGSVRQAIYDILLADSPVNTEVSGRLWFPFAPSQTSLPFIAYRADMDDDSFTKDNSSKLDSHSVEIDIYHNTIEEAEALGAKVYTALQGYMGTINGNIIDGCRLSREDQEFDVEQNPFWTQDYELRLVR